MKSRGLLGALAAVLLLAGLLGWWRHEELQEGRRGRFFQACREGNVRLLERMLREEEGLARTPLGAGMTPLHAAAGNFQLRSVDLLLAHGADPNALGNGRLTPLHAAVQRGYRPVVEHLLDRGASLEAPDEDGWTPLHWAVLLGYQDLVRTLVGRGADIARKDVWGRSPLDYAVRLGPPRLMDRIRPGTSSRLGLSMSELGELASRGRYPEVMEVLQKAPERLSERDAFGCTPLHQAIRSRHVYLAVNATSLDPSHRCITVPGPLGLTPLHLALLSQDPSIVKRFTGKPGLELDSQDETGATALHWALKLRNPEFARMLVAAGARTDLADRRGRTPLALARLLQLENVARYLEEQGVRE